jgi:hypothetical protein
MDINLIDSYLPQFKPRPPITLPALGDSRPEAEPAPAVTPLYAGVVAKLGNPFKRKNGGK